MTDEEFVFRQTERERKRNGIGTFKKVRQGGKNIRFPSDNLSAKERKKMNGEVKQYDFSKPMAWADFIKMPDDLCQEYLDMMTDKYKGVSATLIAEAMGVSGNVAANYLFRHKLKVNSTGMKRTDFFETDEGKGWVRWTSGDIEHADEVAEANDIAKDEEAKVEETKAEVKDCVPQKADVNIQNIATLLRMLQGTGAKLTIEINL